MATNHSHLPHPISEFLNQDYARMYNMMIHLENQRNRVVYTYAVLVTALHALLWIGPSSFPFSILRELKIYIQLALAIFSLWVFIYGAFLVRFLITLRFEQVRYIRGLNRIRDTLLASFEEAFNELVYRGYMANSVSRVGDAWFPVYFTPTSVFTLLSAVLILSTSLSFGLAITTIASIRFLRRPEIMLPVYLGSLLASFLYLWFYYKMELSRKNIPQGEVVIKVQLPQRSERARREYMVRVIAEIRTVFDQFVRPAVDQIQQKSLRLAPQKKMSYRLADLVPGWTMHYFNVIVMPPSENLFYIWILFHYFDGKIIEKQWRHFIGSKPDATMQLCITREQVMRERNILIDTAMFKSMKTLLYCKSAKDVSRFLAKSHPRIEFACKA